MTGPGPQAARSAHVLLFSLPCFAIMTLAWLALINHDSWQHPGFSPYWPILRRLRQQAAAEAGADAAIQPHDGRPVPDPHDPDNWCSEDWLQALNRLASWRGLVNAKGVALRFVRGEDAGALDYERRILEAGEIACRDQGAGARHDFHNALVWLRFPRLKGIFNQLHCEQGQGGQGEHAASTPSLPRGRGPQRDAITLLDEGGAIWPGPATAWVEALEARQWARLFGQYRGALQARFAPVIIGHGLLEKLHRPYKSMTAKLLVCTSPRTGLDRGAALQVRDMAAAGIFWPRVLVPMPIQGWPGWDPANEAPEFYEDARVFRLPR